MDLDGDGVLSMYELEYFYKEQVEKMEQLGIETLPFEDTLCQVMTRRRMRNQIEICGFTYEFIATLSGLYFDVNITVHNFASPPKCEFYYHLVVIK